MTDLFRGRPVIDVGVFVRTSGTDKEPYRSSRRQHRAKARATSWRVSFARGDPARLRFRARSDLLVGVVTARQVFRPPSAE